MSDTAKTETVSFTVKGKRARGILKRKPDEKPFRQWWAKYKKQEKALEEARYGRLRSR